MSENMRLFHKLYVGNLLKVDWNASDLKLSISREIDSDVQEKLNDSVINSFMRYISEILDYVTDEIYEKSEILTELEAIMGHDFDTIILEAEKRVTLIEQTIESLNVEYLTKRSYRDINRVLGHNVKLKFNLSSEQSFNVELDERQLGEMSEALLSTLEKLKELES